MDAVVRAKRYKAGEAECAKLLQLSLPTAYKKAVELVPGRGDVLSEHVDSLESHWAGRIHTSRTSTAKGQAHMPGVSTWTASILRKWWSMV